MTCSVQPIYSTLASDPDYGDLVVMYVEEMPERVEQIRDAYNANDRETLIRLIHQLKGAAGSYGFGLLTDLAITAEQSLTSQSEDIAEIIEVLLATCAMVRAGTPLEDVSK